MSDKSFWQLHDSARRDRREDHRRQQTRVHQSQRPSSCGRDALGATDTNRSVREEMGEAIRAGTPRLGMTKTQVLLTRGYPPTHETPSLSGPRWKYWQNRFGTRMLVFDGDVVVEGSEVY